MDLKKYIMGGRRVDRSGLGYGYLVGLYEYGNEPLGFINA
jgi:hypothetical protein